jgi:hypothetical protein
MPTRPIEPQPRIAPCPLTPIKVNEWSKGCLLADLIARRQGTAS